MHFPELLDCLYNIFPRKPWFTITKLVEEHAVLFAPVLVLQDDVNAPVLCISDGLPVTKFYDEHFVAGLLQLA